MNEVRVSQEKTKKKRIKMAARVSGVKKGGGGDGGRRVDLMALRVVVEPKPRTAIVVVGHSREAEIGGRKG